MLLRVFRSRDTAFPRLAAASIDHRLLSGTREHLLRAFVLLIACDAYGPSKASNVSNISNVSNFSNVYNVPVCLHSKHHRKRHCTGTADAIYRPPRRISKTRTASLFSQARSPAMASRDDGDRDVDFQLVSTYIPVLVLMLRGVGLCVLCEVWYRVLGPRQNLLVVLLVISYSDAYYWRNDKMNSVLGFLCPVVVCLLTTTDHTLCSPRIDRAHARLPEVAVFWTLQVLWPVTSAYYFAAVIFQLRRPRELALVAFWMLCLSAHCVLLLGGHQSTGDIMLRCMVYYMFGMLFYHSKARLEAIDRNTHNCMSLHVSLHLLFVDIYIMVPNVAVLCILAWYVFFGRGGRPSERHGSSQERHGTSAAPSTVLATKALPAHHPHVLRNGNEDEVLSQLRAAKALLTNV